IAKICLGYTEAQIVLLMSKNTLLKSLNYDTLGFMYSFSNVPSSSKDITDFNNRNAKAFNL
ncbi:16521_t:CDS:1, partial [Entrophospora sp. SA101]